MNFPRYERYKDSGVEWLGEIPEHWSVRKIKFLSQYNQEALEESTDLNLSLKYVDIGSVSQGSINKVEEFIFKNAPSRARRKAKKGSTVISTVRTYLKAIAYVNSDASEYVFSTGFCVLYPSHHINNVFFTYLLQSEDFISEVIRSSKGVSYPAITPIKLCNIKVCFPSLAEQERIAEFLDRKFGEIGEAIAKKQRLIELLDEQKTILINQAVTKGLNPDAPMKDSAIDWLGQIPAHWETKKLKYLFREVDNRSENGSETLLSLRMYEGLVPHNDVSEKRIQAENLIGYKKIKKGQIVMNRMRAAIGLFGLASCSGLVSPDYAVFDPWKKLEEQYFLWLFKTDALKDTFRLESKGLGTGSSGFLRLYFDRFGMIKVPFPGVQEQKQIVAYIDTTSTAISKAVSRINKHIEIMKELKQILIAEAVTGKIKV